MPGPHKKASLAGAAALFLPEASDYVASNAAETISLCQPVSRSDFVQGSNPQPNNTISPSAVKNTLLRIDASGTITHRYQKPHLFDVDIKNGPILKESNSVEPGPRIEPPFTTTLGKIGSLICFDLRFPEPSLALRHRGAEILLYPSAFTVPTGKAHWETLLRARAIETQSYVIAAAQCGVHNEEKTRRSYGHSMIVDPWGTVVAELGGEEDGKGRGLDVGEIAVAEIDLEGLERVRREVPLLRRPDAYGEIV
ncbi:carbon-nitrogen hydrolase [Byssothecium circinans]|uniref:Carbon-nitrogen hydrolase n=1 Tax=Byssothecium circinans TaxID=147558 RepID=A0A6A5TVE5_9PLEO|nr:carbon-nitrogen hydrolase [Byssothecium circinans]